MNPSEDPWVQSELEAAIAPYRGIWSEEAIAAFREEMLATLASHPTLLRLLREVRPAIADPSGEVRVTDHRPVPAAAARRTGSK